MAPVYILRCGDEVALVERPAKGLLGGMAGLPTSAWLETALTPSEAAAAAPVEARWRLVGAIDHVFTHFSLTLDVYQAESSTRAPGMAWRSLAAARAAIPPYFARLSMSANAWPELDYAASAQTLRALHLFTQIVGKTRLAQTPWLNHSWSVPLYISPRGLTTGLVPHGDRAFDVEFDLIESVLRLRTEADAASFALPGLTVAAFHHRFLGALSDLGVPVTIDGAPNELPEATPFRDDHAPRAYDLAVARKFHRVLLTADRLLKTFRTGFLGKASPTHFFWGSFDLAVTRFSGRRAPPHPWRRPSPARRRRPGSLLPRSQQRRLLARRPRR